MSARICRYPLCRKHAWHNSDFCAVHLNARPTYRVRGTWPFPTDMLRFDESEPATEADQNLVDLLSIEHAPPEVFDPATNRFRVYVVTLRYLGDRGRWFEPTARRWESFLWRVVTKPSRSATRTARRTISS